MADLVVPLAVMRDPPPHDICFVTLDIRRHGLVLTGDGALLLEVPEPPPPHVRSHAVAGMVVVWHVDASAVRCFFRPRAGAHGKPLV